MSKKRCRSDDTSKSSHTRHKKLKDEHGGARRVDPTRFDAAAKDKTDTFPMPLPCDNDADNNADNDLVADMSTKPEDSEFGLLLYQLASLDVGNHNQQNDAPQTCPICSSRVSLKKFPDHVHRCLDNMDASDRHDMRSQTDSDSDFAAAYALKHGYLIDYDFGQCPSCGKKLILGNSMNEHVNLCLDENMEREEMKRSSTKHEGDEDDDICFNKGISSRYSDINVKKKVEPLSREQMIECASKLMTLQQGTKQYDNMLEMFGALGFNKKNVQSVLEIEKKQQSNPNLNHNKHTGDPSQHQSNYNNNSHHRMQSEENGNRPQTRE